MNQKRPSAAGILGHPIMVEMIVTHGAHTHTTPAEMEKLMEAYHGNIAMTEAHSSRLELEMLLAAERKLSNSLLIQVRHFIQSHRCPPGTI